MNAKEALVEKDLFQEFIKCLDGATSICGNWSWANDSNLMDIRTRRTSRRQGSCLLMKFVVTKICVIRKSFGWTTWWKSQELWVRETSTFASRKFLIRRWLWWQISEA
jgi:hypothetical protein